MMHTRDFPFAQQKILGLVIALVALFCVMGPWTYQAQALTVDTTTAKSNETSTNNILGDTPTRITWEGVVDQDEQISNITLQMPEGSSFESDTSIKPTILDGTKRLKTETQTNVDDKNLALNVAFDQPVTAGQRIRLELYKVSLPNVDGDVALSGTYTTADGQVHDLSESPSITITKASPQERISNWLGEQPWVKAWNSNTVLRLFLNPQLVVTSIPTVAYGWLLSMLLVLIGFPLALPLGLLGSLMKVSKRRIFNGLASIYTGLVRGTPLFLQIYVAFFGLPLMGINLNQYVLAVFVLAFNSGAYMTEIIRAGIQSIPRGQEEAARSLGMNHFQTTFSVIIPQTVRRIIPTMTNEFILLYKDTSLLAAVGVMELMLYSRGIVAVTGNMTPYMVAAVFYLIVTLPLTHVATKFEKRLAIADGNAAPTKKKKTHFLKKDTKHSNEDKEIHIPLGAQNDPVAQPSNENDKARQIAVDKEEGLHD